MPIRPGRRRQPAFTLVELLVVIGIIGVIVAITFPALAGARAAARQTECLSDLRQMGIALNLYTNDNREYLPNPNWGPVAERPGWLYGPGVVAQQAVETDHQSGALWPYVEVAKAYRCPSHKGPFAGTANMTSYIMNGAVIGYGRVTTPYRVGQMRSDAVLLWDANEHPEFGPPYNDGSSYPTEIVPGHHGPSITCMGADASSTTIRNDEFVALRADAGPNRMWCNPGTRDGH